MCDFDIEKVRITLVKAVRMIVAVRAFLKPLGKEWPEIPELEREFREAAGEVQRVEKGMKEGSRGPLAKGEGLN